jgi:hypothetical protein
MIRILKCDSESEANVRYKPASELKLAATGMRTHHLLLLIIPSQSHRARELPVPAVAVRGA